MRMGYGVRRPAAFMEADNGRPLAGYFQSGGAGWGKEMPVNVLIADDESIAREALKLFFDRNFPECGVSLAKDGLEALRLCKTRKFDLALIDIEMPGLTGLELMGSLKQNGFDGQLLVITAYSRFSYAQKVVELGASAYILKPIQTEELRVQVSACLEKQRKKLEISSKQQDMQIRLVEAFRPAEKDFWNALQKQKYFTLQKMLEEGVLGFSQIMGRLLRVKPGAALRTAADVQTLEHTLRLVFTKHFTVYLNASDEGDFCIFLNSGISDKEYLEFAPYLLAAVFIENGYPKTQIWCSRSLSCVEDLCLAWRGKVRFSQDGAPVLWERQSHFSSLKKNTSLQNRLMRAASGNPAQRANAIRFLQDSYFSDAKEEEEVFAAVARIILEIALKLVAADKVEVTIEKLLDIAVSSRKPLAVIEDMLQALAWSQEEEDMEYARIAVDRAVAFMKENLSNPITLSDTAKCAGLSEYHFSRVFSNITGQKYIEFLTELRMERAKSLLESKNMSLNELAQLCGYQSVSHFCTVFKRYTGETVSQYKTHLTGQ